MTAVGLPVTPPAEPASTSAAPAAGVGAPNVIRVVAAVAANATLVTALLVYFGWRRSETHARLLGVDESILGMSTRDYVIRSVGPVLTLLLGIAVCGLGWVWLDQLLEPRLGRGERTARRILLGIRAAALALPPSAMQLARVWPAGAFVAFPAAIGLMVLGLHYAGHLRQQLDGRRVEGGRLLVTHASVALLVAVCLFWTASNYAEVLGIRLATEFAHGATSLPGVVVYSEREIHLEGPGVVSSRLAPENEILSEAGDEAGGLRYRYAGLILLEHTGGRYFLLSEGWSPAYGVVFSFRDDDPSIRVDFVRGEPTPHG